MTTTTTTATTICGAGFEFKTTGCAATIGHNGCCVTAAEIAHFGNTHAAQQAIEPAGKGFWTIIATIVATGIIH